MNQVAHVVVFRLEGQRFALNLSVVERVVRAVEVTPLPKAPAIVLGVINVQGQVLPVFNLRQRFRLPDRALAVTDEIIIARTPPRTVALVVDAVDGVQTCAPDEVVPVGGILPAAEYLSGVVKRVDGLILIHDLDRFLSADEAEQLEGARAHD